MATTQRRRGPQRFAQRHGKAVEPFLPPGVNEEDVKVFVPEEAGQEVRESKNKLKATTESKSEDKKPTGQREPSSFSPLSQETQDAAIIPGDVLKKAPAATASPTPLQQAAANTADPNAPLERVLHMDPPSEPPADPGIPHLHPPPYVHHFDSWTLVKQVEEGGFTNDQSVTAMKAVRGLLAHNLDVAKEGLVSKSDVENVCFYEARYVTGY